MLSAACQVVAGRGLEPTAQVSIYRVNDQPAFFFSLFRRCKHGTVSPLARLHETVTVHRATLSPSSGDPTVNMELSKINTKSSRGGT